MGFAIDPAFWLILMGVLLAIEIVTLGLTTIWFAAGALVSFVAAMLGAPIWLQIVLFLAVSLLMLFFTRPWAEKHFNHNREKTNVNSMIGKQGKVVSEINNLEQCGTVKVNGVEWSARSTSDDVIVEEGSIVEIKKIEGVKTFVEKVK